MKIIVRTIAVALWLSLFAGYFVFEPKNIMMVPAQYSPVQLQQLRIATRTDLETPQHEKYVIWTFSVPHHKKVVLFSRGMGGNVATVIDKIHLLNELGCTVYAFDFLSGDPSITYAEHGISVCTSALDWVAKRDKSVVLYGESLGASIEAQTLLQRSASAFVLDCAPSSIPRAMHDSAPFFAMIYPPSAYPNNKFETDKICDSLSIPKLFIHGQLDDTVRWQYAVDMYNSAHPPKMLCLLPHSDHTELKTDDADRKKVRESLRQFLQSF